LQPEFTWATPEEATSLGVAMEELSDAQATVLTSKGSHSIEEVNYGCEEATLKTPTPE
jgi:hypothetical protein